MKAKCTHRRRYLLRSNYHAISRKQSDFHRLRTAYFLSPVLPPNIQRNNIEKWSILWWCAVLLVQGFFLSGFWSQPISLSDTQT